MDDFTKQFFAACATLIILVSSVAWAISWHMTKVACTAMEKGYTSEMIPGSDQPQWVKK